MKAKPIESRRSRPARRTGRIAPCAVLLLALAGGGCEKQAGQGGFSPPPMPVETAPVSTGTVADRFATVGTIAAADEVTVTSEIDGVVVDLPFREGGTLQQGELIARLDDRQLQAEARRAEAVLAQRQAAHRRIKEIVDQGAGAPQDLDDAVSALKVAEAELALARTRLDKTRITAPFTGVAGVRRVSPGAFLRAGSAVTDLARLEQLRLNFSVPERLLGRLQVGAAVDVETTAYPGETVRGVIDVIEPQLDPQTRAAGVVALVDNPDVRLRPGMSATVSIVLAERAGALTIPSDAVFVSGGQTFVFMVQADSTVVRTPVELGSRTAGAVEVVSGLDAAANVVSAGHQKLYDGARIMPIPAGSGGPGGPGGPPQGDGAAQPDGADR